MLRISCKQTLPQDFTLQSSWQRAVHKSTKMLAVALQVSLDCTLLPLHLELLRWSYFGKVRMHLDSASTAID